MESIWSPKNSSYWTRCTKQTFIATLPLWRDDAPVCAPLHEADKTICQIRQNLFRASPYTRIFPRPPASTLLGTTAKARCYVGWSIKTRQVAGRLACYADHSHCDSHPTHSLPVSSTTWSKVQHVSLLWFAVAVAVARGLKSKDPR